MPLHVPALLHPPVQALVAGDNLCQALPPVVCQLGGLQQLLLPLNPLRCVPPDIGRLTALEWL